MCEEMNISDENEYKNSYPVKEDIKVATMTLCCKINCNIHVDNLVKYHKLEQNKIEKIKYGSSKKKDVEEVKISAEEAKKCRKNKKKKNNFYNQVTIVIKPFSSRKNGINMKLSDNGSIQMTGATSVEEGHLTIRKMLEYLYEWSGEIFYTKENTIKTVDDSSTTTETSESYKFLSQDDISNVKILSTDCELIIVSFGLPFFIHLKKLNDIFKSKYKLLSIFGTSSYPGVNTKFTYSSDCKHTEHIKKKKKYLCDCRDMSIFTFRTGKVIITGFENLEKIQKVFDEYIHIIKTEEEIIKIENSNVIGKELTPIKKMNSKIMRVGNKTFEVVSDF
jgi:TATA-box binding protein (TBP) (component of TFIID and TFIIIB)